jgi:cysteine desulfuration protein SufE
MNLSDRQKQIVDEFSALKTWEDRYKKIIEIGKALPPLEAKFKVDENIVKGCQSQVWLVANLDAKKHIIFQADSDALIVRGLVALLIRVYSNAEPAEILAATPDFIRALGFESNLSPSRANGLIAMVKQMKYYAAAFQHIVSAT